GMGRVMPYTFAAFSVAAISIIGLPPTLGFLAKWDMLEGAVESEQFLFVVVIGLGTMLNTAYFLPIIYKAFLTLPAVISKML
ncbi:MAG: proton-conducting transporter membrane subunit, partial [Betaproteobacteria bacterium]